MDMSLFFAKLLGLYFLIVSALFLVRRHQLEGAWKEVVSSKGILAISAEFSLLFGLVIVLQLPVLEGNWRGLVTLIGYLLILRGLIRFAFPHVAKNWVAKTTEKGHVSMLIVMIIVGIYLTYCGFCFSAFPKGL